MNPDKVICPCKDVTKGDILKAIKKGADSYKDIQKETKAGTKCGKCEKDIKHFLKKHKDDFT